jgi:phosphatidylglycerophosphate synthase
MNHTVMSKETSAKTGHEPDLDKAFKLPRSARYFNVSVLWIFYYTHMIRALYRTKIRHEAVTLISFFFGVAAGVMFLQEGYFALVAAALFVHLKDLFDACDGSLARLRGQTNRIARFLDSLCDFAAITWIIVALAIRLYPEFGPSAAVLALLAWISLFLQCSYFNYYLVAYTKLFGTTNVRHDERPTADDRTAYSAAWKRRVLLVFQYLYKIVYGWQDRLMAAADKKGIERLYRKPPERLTEAERAAWYGDKRLLTLNSPLCFGTHLFMLIVASLLSFPQLFLYTVVIAGNVYLFAIYLYRLYRIAPSEGPE